jgi:hypothetical protein
MTPPPNEATLRIGPNAKAVDWQHFTRFQARIDRENDEILRLDQNRQMKLMKEFKFLSWDKSEQLKLKTPVMFEEGNCGDSQLTRTLVSIQTNPKKSKIKVPQQIHGNIHNKIYI